MRRIVAALVLILLNAVSAFAAACRTDCLKIPESSAAVSADYTTDPNAGSPCHGQGNAQSHNKKTARFGDCQRELCSNAFTIDDVRKYDSGHVLADGPAVEFASPILQLSAPTDQRIIVPASADHQTDPPSLCFTATVVLTF